MIVSFGLVSGIFGLIFRQTVNVWRSWLFIDILQGFSNFTVSKSVNLIQQVSFLGDIEILLELPFSLLPYSDVAHVIIIANLELETSMIVRLCVWSFVRPQVADEAGP